MADSPGTKLADERVDWMRDQGVVSATWSESGVLLAATIGPKPFNESPRTAPKSSPQQKSPRGRATGAIVPLDARRSTA